ncbi:MAG: HisA/HisF-related TIM barrel protein [Evtepia sp.]
MEHTGMFVEVGGGIRTEETIATYLSAGVGRVILGTAAVTQTGFVSDAIRRFGDQIAVGIDVKDDKVAINGWQDTTPYTCDAFCQKMQDIGVSTIICTDIAKDGAMGGTNRSLYRRLTEKFSMQIIASGGVSTLDDVAALRDSGVYGAIIGKAYYTGAIDLASAISRAGGAK